LNKYFIAQVVEERGQQQQAILHKLDLWIKNLIEALYRVVYNIDIIMIDPKDVKTNPLEAIEPT
jgi:hypothetical protein